MKVKVFDVVELNNNERGTILNVNGNNCLIEIVGENKKKKNFKKEYFHLKKKKKIL